MPPGTVTDPWLAGRNFGIVIDAGSSGSRVQIYSWRNPSTVLYEEGAAVVNTLPKVEKGTKVGEDWAYKIQPGISSFADHLDDIPKYLRPLLHHAREHIPPSLYKKTPLFLYATAGMRLLPAEKQAAILSRTCDFLLHHSDFHIDAPSKAGPCGGSIRIITGEEEGLFGWIAVNYLMDGFIGSSEHPTTYGFLDMGGASTQIAFEPAKEHQGKAKSLIDVRLRLLGGEEIHHKVFVTTWLGYGTNQARERYVGRAIEGFEKSRISNSPDIVPDPCLPTDLELVESPVYLGPASEHNSHSHTLVGTGSFEKCIEETYPLLNKTAPCPDTNCLMNGIYVPPIDFSVSHFIGVSEYWYSSEQIFGLGGAYDFLQYERAAAHFCSRHWADILEEHNQFYHHHHPPIKTYPSRREDPGSDWELDRLRMQCFKAAWVVNVLHNGLGMPRIVDPGGNATSGSKEGAEDVVAHAESKGLGRPTFQSANTIGDLAITWTLGKMVLEASKQVPTKLKSDRPLVDPLDEVAEEPDFPIQPIRPFLDLQIIEDKISPHLPTSLQRSSLGFSPVLFFFGIILIVVIILFGYPLRKHIRGLCLRCLQRTTSRKFSDASYSLEEGKPLTNGYPNGNGLGRIRSRPPSRIPSRAASPTRGNNPVSVAAAKILRPVHRVISTSSLSGHVTPPKLSPRSPSFTSINNGVAGGGTTIEASALSISRSSSPAPGMRPSNSGGSDELGARSRNASTVNLSNLMTRQTAAVSRTGSQFRGD